MGGPAAQQDEPRPDVRRRLTAKQRGANAEPLPQPTGQALRLGPGRPVRTPPARAVGRYGTAPRNCLLKGAAALAPHQAAVPLAMGSTAWDRLGGPLTNPLEYSNLSCQIEKILIERNDLDPNAGADGCQEYPAHGPNPVIWPSLNLVDFRRLCGKLYCGSNDVQIPVTDVCHRLGATSLLPPLAICSSCLCPSCLARIRRVTLNRLEPVREPQVVLGSYWPWSGSLIGSQANLNRGGRLRRSSQAELSTPDACPRTKGKCRAKAARID